MSSEAVRAAVDEAAAVQATAPTHQATGTHEAPAAPRILSVEDILTAPDIDERVVEVPEWGGAVKIRSFTKQRQIQLREKAVVNGDVDSERMELLMFIEGVVEPQFSIEHIELLRGKSASAMDRVLSAILDLGGMTPERQKEMEQTFRQEPGT